MQIMTRKEAIASGLKRYFTGIPCPKGHISDRRITGACGGCAREQKREWNKTSPKAKVAKLAWQAAHRESANTRQRRWLAENREQSNAASAAWAEANPGKCTARAAKRRSAKLQRTPPWADLDAIAGMYELAQVFRRIGLEVEVDHAIPLQGRKVSGLHVADNLQLIHSIENRAKSNRFAIL